MHTQYQVSDKNQNRVQAPTIFFFFFLTLTVVNKQSFKMQLGISNTKRLSGETIHKQYESTEDEPRYKRGVMSYILLSDAYQRVTTPQRTGHPNYKRSVLSYILPSDAYQRMTTLQRTGHPHYKSSVMLCLLPSKAYQRVTQPHRR